LPRRGSARLQARDERTALHRDAMMKSMAKKTVRFVAVETVRKPATVRFKTKSGKTVSFKAVKTFAQKKVRFRANKTARKRTSRK
jgi:arginyl-tRNA synthetase